MQGPMHWRSSRLWQRLMKLLQRLGAKTPFHRARTSAARSQHATCNPLPRKMSPQRPSRSGLKLVRLPVSQVIWTANRNSCSSPSSRLMSTCLPGNHRKCLGSLGR
jgi:hypothetical protein